MIEKMGIDRNGPLVNLLYRNAAPGQHIRELIQNGLDAGATWIDLGIDQVAVGEGEPRRLMYRDNGRGMTADELRAYFNHLSSSSGLLGDQHGNYGIGAKISLLPWNHAGVRILSWVDGPDSGAEILIQAGDDGEYGLRVFEAEDEDGDRVSTSVIAADDRYCPPWVGDPEHPEYTGRGTVVVCLGDTGTEDTYFGPPGDERKVTGLIRRVNTRYYNFGREVAVRCWTDIAGGGEWRVATGTEVLLDGCADEWDTVELIDGTRVHWYVLNQRFSSQTTDRMGYRTGFIGALYRDERTGATEIYNASKAGAENFYRMRLFGILEPKVQQRVALLVEAPRANGIIGVCPNAARSSLDYTGSDDGSLPWADWGPEFAQRLPEPIQALLEEARGDGGPRRNMREKLKHVLQRMRHPAYRVDDRGPTQISPDVPGRPEPSGQRGITKNPVVRTVTPRVPKTPVANVTSDGGANATQFNPKLDPPQPRWQSENEEEYAEVLRDRAVDYDWRAPRDVIMNRDFFVFAEERKYWSDQFPQAPPSTVRDVIEEEYETLVVATIMHAWTRKGSFKWTPQDWEQLVHPITLTASCLGFHLERAIRKALSVKVGKAVA